MERNVSHAPVRSSPKQFPEVEWPVTERVRVKSALMVGLSSSRSSNG